MSPTDRQARGTRGTEPYCPSRPPAVAVVLADDRPTHRRRLRASRALLHHIHSRHPATVWPCGQDDHRDGAAREGMGLIAPWLHSAIVKIVTTYSRPGDRVLLLAPPRLLAPPAPGPHSFSGLHEAGWTIARLGRGVRTDITTDSRTRHTDSPADRAPCPSTTELTGPESGSGRRPGRSRHPDPAQPTGPDAAAPTDPDSAGTERFDLIITGVDPQTPDWFATLLWADHLQSHGALAVVTHSDRRSGRWVDPAGVIVAAAKRAGLAYLDHVALLETSIRRGRLAPTVATANSPRTTPGPEQADASTVPRTPVRVHADLYVFTHADSVPMAVASAVNSGESSDV